MLDRFSRFDRFKKSKTADRQRSDIDVWLNPAAGSSVYALAHQIGAGVHLVVVPKTGSRRADIAVLSDPDPGELEGIARLLPGMPLLAATTGAPTSALRAAARKAGAKILAAPSAEELLSEIRRLCTKAPRTLGAATA